MSKKLDIAIVSDEISNDFREAVRYGISWGVRKYEIRNLNSGRVPDIDESEVEDVVSCIEENDILVTALSPGLFKLPLTNTVEIEKQITDALPRTIQLAKKVGAKIIIVFGFLKMNDDPKSHFDKAVKYLNEFGRIVAEHGMIAAIENEPGFWCDSGSNTLKILEAVNSPSLKANWDPANAYGCGEEPFPDGYNLIKNWIGNVHVKDTKCGSLVQCVPVGKGNIDWENQLRSLVQDNLVEHVTIETHCHPSIETSEYNVRTVRAMIEAISRGALEVV